VKRAPRIDLALAALAFGYVFLYLPILLVVVFSFNDSRLVSVWGGASLRWYGELLHNDAILRAAWLSLRVGLVAGIALARVKSFRGRILFSGMIAAPLVMPEVITGLSLLLLFVSLRSLFGWPSGRGTTTLVIAHITFCMAYVAVIVQSRLASMDESLEEAAMDLGGRPLRVLVDITLPLIAPAMMSGWLLAFTLSIDDLVISSFVSGPGATTLPMLIFSKARLGVTPDINALASLMILVVSVAVAIAGWLMLREERRRVRAMQAAASD
jgi:putrescine transport system permease protein